MHDLFTMPALAHNFARAKAQLKRDDTVRALGAMLVGLQDYNPKKFPGKVRFEIEVLIQECVAELNRQPAVRVLFEELVHSPKASIPYTPGQEKKLFGLLTIVHKALTEKIAAEEENAAAVVTGRKATLEQKGLQYLRSGDFPRGKAALRVLAEEFGNEAGVYAQVGEWLLDHKLYYEAAEMLEASIDAFPKVAKAYGLAASCYREVKEYEKAEAVYLKAIKAFGKHPRTLLNLATLYLAWNKKEDAFRAAQDAYKKDPSLTEAKEIVDKYA